MEAAGVEVSGLAAGWPARFKYWSGRDRLAIRRVLAEFVWPDRWAGFGLRAGRWLARNAERFDLVISSAFPWSDLLPGLRSPGATRDGSWTTVIHGRSRTSCGNWRRTPEYRVERGSFAPVTGSSSRPSQPATCSPAISISTRIGSSSSPPVSSQLPASPVAELAADDPACRGGLWSSALPGSVSWRRSRPGGSARARRPPRVVRPHRRSRNARGSTPPRGRISSLC